MVNSAIAISHYKDWINGSQGFKVQLLWLHMLPNICKVQLFMAVTIENILFFIYMKKKIKKIPLKGLLTYTLNMCSIKNAQ